MFRKGQMQRVSFPLCLRDVMNREQSNTAYADWNLTGNNGRHSPHEGEFLPIDTTNASKSLTLKPQRETRGLTNLESHI